MANKKVTTAKIATAVLKRNAERLGDVSERLMKAYNTLAGAELTEATMPWTPSHTKTVDRFVYISGLFESAADIAVDAASENRLSDIEERKQRNQADYRKRVAKKRADGVEPKKRGRPKKDQ